MRAAGCHRRLASVWAAVLLVLGSAPSPAAQSPRIGLLAWSKCEAPSLLRGLKDLGYKPGETVIIECRSADRRYDGLTRAAAELVEMGVDVIVTMSQPAGTAARDATELTAKRLQLLREAVPDLTTVGVLANPSLSYLPFEDDTARAGRELGISVKVRHVSESADLPAAFSVMREEGAQAVFVLPDMMLASAAGDIAELAMEHRLPTMAWGGWYTQLGCLMAYSAQYPKLAYRLAFYVDRVLKGAAPGDLSIEQPTEFELSINLKTAQALGLTLPQSLLLRADQVIE